jgi:antitoxin FitA
MKDMSMAKTIQIRDVPDDVHATLRARAAAAGVSLSDYVLAQIQRLASRPTVAEVLLRAQERAGSGPSVDAIVDAVRAAREERDGRFDEIYGLDRKSGD